MDINTLWLEFISTIHRLMEKYISTQTLCGLGEETQTMDQQNYCIRAMHMKRNKLFKKQKAKKNTRTETTTEACRLKAKPTGS